MASQVFLCQQNDLSTSLLKDFITSLHSTDNKKIQFISPPPETFIPPNDQKYPTVAEYVTRLCRHHNLLVSSRVTVLSQEDSLQALQLCLAHRNKEQGETFDAESSKVFQYHQKILTSKLNPDDITSSQTSSELSNQYASFLSACSHVDMADLATAFNKELQKDSEESELQKDLSATVLVLLGAPRSQIERFLIERLCRNITITELIPEGLLDDSAAFCQHEKTFKEILPIVEETPTKVTSQNSIPVQQMFTSRVLLSYLHILVNSRSELALAKIFNVPDRDLDRQAFTALKHQAKKKNMSMFQTATSYLMRIRLGGKGYAPNIDCPLNPHTKGLGELIDLIHNLQTVAEEDPDIRSACRRLLNIVKNRLVKCQSLKLRREDAEEATSRLYQCVLTIIEDLENTAVNSPDKPASEGGSLIGRKTLRVIRLLLDKIASCQGGDNSQFFLTDIALNPTTPTRVPCLLSQFRSPELPSVEDASPDKICEPTGLVDRTNTRALDTSEVVLPCGEKMTRKQLNTVIVLPSKTVAHPAPETVKLLLGLKPTKKLVSCAAMDKENIRTKPALESEQPAKKRKITEKVVKKVAPVDNSTSQTSVELCPSQAVSTQDKKKAQVSKKGCRRRLLPQVKGQQKLTGFFRV